VSFTLRARHTLPHSARQTGGCISVPVFRKASPENRLINPDRRGNRPIKAVEIFDTGSIMHVKGYGLIKVFKIVAKNGDIG
jgi:hypothetical protein